MEVKKYTMPIDDPMCDVHHPDLSWYEANKKASQYQSLAKFGNFRMTTIVLHQGGPSARAGASFLSHPLLLRW